MKTIYWEGRGMSSGVTILGSVAGKEALWTPAGRALRAERTASADVQGGRGAACTWGTRRPVDLEWSQQAGENVDEIREGMGARPWSLDHWLDFSFYSSEMGSH